MSDAQCVQIAALTAMSNGWDERINVLQSVKNLFNCRVGATDGLAGGVVDFYFNDHDWSIRHIITSQHPTRLLKAALLNPASVTRIDNVENVLIVTFSRRECETLPAANTVVPVCRQKKKQTTTPSRNFE